MSKRYAIDIHLVEVDEKGQVIATLDTKTTDDVTTDLFGLKEGMRYMRECLGYVVYDHLEDAAKLTNRETGEMTYPDIDDDDGEESPLFVVVEELEYSLYDDEDDE